MDVPIHQTVYNHKRITIIIVITMLRRIENVQGAKPAPIQSRITSRKIISLGNMKFNRLQDEIIS